MFKKLLSLSLGIISLFILAPVSLAHQYKDVPQGTTYYYPVDYLRRNDVFKDTPYFYPDKLISKAEFIKYLVILNSPDFRPSGTASLPFEDTRNNAWYASYFKEAIKLGILDDRERKAEPNKKLTVIDALTLLFHSQSIPIPNVFKGNIPYTDVARNKQASPLIMRALQLDVISPKRTDYVGIYQRVTRAAAARMIYKMDLVTLGPSPSSSASVSQVNLHSPQLNKLVNVWQLIENNYLNRDQVNQSEVVNNVLKHLVDQLDDPYSRYMDEKENTAFLDQQKGELEGIGAVIGFNKKKEEVPEGEKQEVTVVSPIQGGPAHKAGLKAGDVILEVDGIRLAGMSLEDAVMLIKGPKGTTVSLKIRRGTGNLILMIERDLIQVPTLEYELIDGGSIMHATLYQFNAKAPEEFQSIVNDLKNNSGIKGLILDLRGNPGGLLDSAVRIAGYFIKAQEEVVGIEYADYSQVLLSGGPADLADFSTIILIDEGSASASEIVAGALQDYGLATIVGKTSFGKGTVQAVEYFNDHSSLKLTVAKWLTPKRQDIQNGGITPDVVVTDDEATEKDEQLDRAVLELKKLMR